MSRVDRSIRLFLAAVVVAAPASVRAAEPQRSVVPKDLVWVDDGDGLVVRWPEGPEDVRILGIDAPETQHLEHDIPHAQPFGDEARGFLAGCLAAADEVTLMRAPGRDRYGRTLAYLFVDGKNYSVLVLRARLAAESVTRYGENGFPVEAAACLEASRAAGPVPFEDPHAYRSRMRELSAWLKARGLYPTVPERAPPPPK